MKANKLEMFGNSRGEESWYENLSGQVILKYPEVESVDYQGGVFVVKFKDGLEMHLLKKRNSNQGKLDVVIGKPDDISAETPTELVNLEAYLEKSIEVHIFFSKLAEEIRRLEGVKGVELIVGEKLIITLADDRRLEPAYNLNDKNREQIRESVTKLIKDNLR